MVGMASLSDFTPVPDPSLGPEDCDSRVFTPESMDEYDAFLAATAVEDQAA